MSKEWRQKKHPGLLVPVDGAPPVLAILSIWEQTIPNGPKGEEKKLRKLASYMPVVDAVAERAAFAAGLRAARKAALEAGNEAGYRFKGWVHA